MQIRPARSDDVHGVVALVESAYRGDASRAGWTTEADLLDGQRTDAEEVRDVLPHLLLAEDGTGLVACCALVPREDHAYFGMFAVRPGLQGAGLGSRLLAAAEDRARSNGMMQVRMTVLTVRAELIAFYERRGYVLQPGTEPFPYGDERFGRPQRDDLVFGVLAKDLSGQETA